MHQMSQTFPGVPEGTGGSRSSLDVTGQFWRCLDGSGESGSSSETGISWLASPVGAVAHGSWGLM